MLARAIEPAWLRPVALPDFVNQGGDAYTMFVYGERTIRELMADVLLDHVETLGTLTPATNGRITQLP